MRIFLCWLCLFFSAETKAQDDTLQKIVPGRRNSPEQQKKPYVILISADGFRYDYAKKHGAVNLLSLSAQGVSADYMRPSFPSLTFPNHYTIVTGMYPAHHGLVGNRFYEASRRRSYSMSRKEEVKDGSWYGGIPLWVLAEQQQMLTASFYWVGSEAPVKGIHPTYYYIYNEKISIDRRVEVVKNWLQLPEDQRPHLISFYFPEVDHSGHDFGPDSPENGEAVRTIDTAIYKLTKAVESTGLPVSFIFLSDHGMTNINTDEWLQPPIDTSKVVVARSETMLQVYVKNKDEIQKVYQSMKATAKNYSVVLKTEMPERLHYGVKDDVMNRIGDIILIAEWPYVFYSSATRKPDPGTHGYDPDKVTEMRAVFYAWGPAFKKGKQVKPFENIHVYPVVTSMLGLNYDHKIDGRKKLARRILNH